MDDQAIRDLETTFIINSVASELLDRSNLSNACIADYGCGNGFTLVKLAERFPNLNYKGLEYTPELREIANSKKVYHVWSKVATFMMLLLFHLESIS